MEWFQVSNISLNDVFKQMLGIVWREIAYLLINNLGES